jgi:hypothetical protein
MSDAFALPRFGSALPGAGTVQNRQTSFPVDWSNAATNPRTPSSPPDVP